MKGRSLFYFLIFVITFSANAQHGGIPSYPVLSKEQAVKQGYKLVRNTDDLLQQIQIDNNKIFISESFELKAKADITGNNVILESDKKSVITSNLWFDKYRFFDSFIITGKNVTMRGLVLQGNDCDIRTLDYRFAQTGIRCRADSFHIENCSISCFGWANIYMVRYDGALIEQCYLSSSKNAGYGYGVWFEGSPGNTAIVRNCVFENNRESIDAGGQLGAWTATGCIFDKSVQSHKNKQHTGGIGETISGNYFIESEARWNLPAPAVDTGWIVLENNFFATDSPAGQVTGINPKAKISVRNNHFNSEGMSRPVCKLSMESFKDDTYHFSFSSSSSYYEMYWGDGSMPVLNETNKSHAYPVPGTYTPALRVFNSDGIPSVPSRIKIVHGSGLNAAIKTTARSLPAAGYYQVQLLVDDSVMLKYDAADVWSWKRINYMPSQKGKHKIAIRLVCIRDCNNAIQLWIDDFDYNGSIPNSGFEDDKIFHHPPQSNWDQAFKGNIHIGSGITHLESCGGKYSWRFEFRPRKKIVEAGSYAELFQNIVF